HLVNTQNYITKINTDGDILWTKNIHNVNITTGSTNPSVIYVHDLAVDSEDNLYITGDFRRTADFDPGPGTYQLTTGTYPSGFYTYYRKEGFIVKLNAEGDFVWAEKYGVSSGQNNIRIHSLTADNEGFLYALGDRTSGDITGVLYKINASNGNV